MVAAVVGAGRLRGGGGLLRQHAGGRVRPSAADGARARQRRRQQRVASEGALRDGARRPLAGDAGGEPRAEPRVRARRGRHADRATRPSVRRGLRPRRRVLHDDRGRSAHGDRDRVRPLQAGRRRALRPRSRPRELPALHRSWRTRRRDAGPAVPGMDVGSRSRGHHLRGRLRVPAARARRQRCASSTTGTSKGLFSRADWLRLLAEAGFHARVVPFEHSELEPGSHEVFVAKRPAG